jgi:transcription elongation factor GreB
MTDARGLATPPIRPLAGLPRRCATPDRRRRAGGLRTPAPLRALDTERKASFLYPGGLVAVHAEGRDRESSIWRALERREVYGTSGPRILLWFDLLNAPGGRAPMGGAGRMAEAPPSSRCARSARFEQRPGCPADARGALRRAHRRLCRGECHHPGDERVPSRPSRSCGSGRRAPPGRGSIAPLIEDPWRASPARGDPAAAACASRSRLPDAGDDTVYYARALQAPTPAINGANLRATLRRAGPPSPSSPATAATAPPRKTTASRPSRTRLVVADLRGRSDPPQSIDSKIARCQHREGTMGTRTRTRPDESGKPGQITPQGLARLEQEVDRLWRESRVMADKVAVAAAEGDRSENAEYTYSKMRLGALHRKLGFLTRRLKVLTVAEPPADDGHVHFGCWVVIEDDEGGRSTYRIVGPDEFDLANGHISSESPVARALLGRELGDEFVVKLPRGDLRATIVAITVEEPADRAR